MRNLILTAAALAFAAPAFIAPAMAQKPEDRPARQLTGPDVEIIREAVNTVKQDGECVVEFTVSTEGTLKDLKPECDNEAYVPYVLRAMETVTYEPEIFAGEIFDTEGVKQPFKFGRGVAQQAVTPPSVTKAIDPRDVQRAITRGGTGSCDVKFTVGTDGKPKDIAPNCTPEKLNSHIESAVEKMRYKPAESGGEPVEAPISMPLNLGAGD